MIKGADITVVIPAYNAGKYISEAVQSIRNQSLDGNPTIIVVDDGSTDDTSDVSQRLDVVFVKKNRSGAAATRNVGLEMAETPWVFFLDADDVLLPDAFMQLSSAFEKDSELSVVFGMAQDFLSPELPEEEKRKLCPKDKPYAGVMPGCALIKREVFDTVGCFDESLPSGELVSWLIKLRDSGLKTAQIAEVTLMRRLHLSNTGRVSRQAEGAGYAAIIRERLKKHG